MSNPEYRRPHAAELLRRLGEQRRFIQVVTTSPLPIGRSESSYDEDVAVP